MANKLIPIIISTFFLFSLGFFSFILGIIEKMNIPITTRIRLSAPPVLIVHINKNIVAIHTNIFSITLVFTFNKRNVITAINA